MLGLAIESSGNVASAALWRSAHGRISWLADATLPVGGGKADQLITIVEQLLANESLSYPDLALIAVNRGPGSFTGIRSAVALARGLALASGLPVLGVTSHEAVATKLRHDRPDARRDCPLVVSLDARRGEVYVQTFSANGEALTAISSQGPAAVADQLKAGSWYLVGDGAALVAPMLDAQTKVEMMHAISIDASAVALAAVERLFAGDVPVSGDTLKPLYIRAPDAVPPTPLVSKGDDIEVLA
ncbi:MAG: tRNA (adenosine(37)-N6)-threonylcarbamoyltransferase complex dimerization subunit type 1 TsaB [Pseudomonadota bacterium]